MRNRSDMKNCVIPGLTRNLIAGNAEPGPETQLLDSGTPRVLPSGRLRWNDDLIHLVLVD